MLVNVILYVHNQQKQERRISLMQEIENEEIKEFITIITGLNKEDRAILLSNANALKVRQDLENARRQATENDR